MFFWFIILTPVIVAEVFKSPKLDYRLIAVGSLLPLFAKIQFIPNWAHTLVFSVTLLSLVMLLTINKRLLRRRMLGLPIGLMFHLMIDGSWMTKELFWWPMFGFDGLNAFPEFDHYEVSIMLDLVALLVGLWAYKRYELGEKNNLNLLLKKGELNRNLVQK